MDNVEISIMGSSFWNNTVFKDGAGVLVLGNLYANISSSYFWNNYINNLDEKGNIISTELNNIACGTTGSTVYWEEDNCNICSIKDGSSIQFTKKKDKYYPCGEGPSFLTLLITFCILVGVGTIFIVILSVSFFSSYLNQKNLILRKKKTPNILTINAFEEEKRVDILNPFFSYSENTSRDDNSESNEINGSLDDISLDNLVVNSSTCTTVIEEKIENNEICSKTNQNSASEKPRSVSPVYGYPRFQEKTSPNLQNRKNHNKKEISHLRNVSGSFTDLNSAFLKYIQYKELEIDTKNPVGIGSFGIVYKGTWRNNEVAIKKFIKPLNEEQLEQFIIEAQMMRDVCNHKNVIKLFGVCIESPHYCIITPFYKNGSIKDYYIDNKDRKQWKWSDLIKVAKQTAAGIDHLHMENMIHRDIAARNILLNNNLQVRISDFGLARVINNVDYAQTNSSIGAVAWMANESIVERKYSRMSDSYSFGVFLWEICFRKTPFEGIQPIHIALRKVTKNENPPLFKSIDCNPLLIYSPDQEEEECYSSQKFVPIKLLSLIHSCWNIEPTQRPDFSSIYKTLSQLYEEYLDLEK